MNLAAAAQSSVGRKLISGLTGLLLVGFVIGHLIGNLLLLVGPAEFNSYAYFLENFGHGAGLIIAEVGLVIVLLSHAVSGYKVWSNKWSARRHTYNVSADAGGASRKSLSSTTMLWSGILLLVFIAWHVAQFKFGVVDGGVNRQVIVDGVEMRNLFGVVIDSFGNILWVAIYVFVMVLLGLHLWHGVWSALQSLGLANKRYLPTLTLVSHVLAFVLAFGFVALPVVIFLGNEGMQQKSQVYMQEYGVQQSSQAVFRNLSVTPAGLAERGA